MEGPWQRSANVPAGSQALRIVTKGKENGTFAEEKASGVAALVSSQLCLLCCGAQAGDGTGHEPGDLGQVSAACGGSHAGLRG